MNSFFSLGLKFVVFIILSSMMVCFYACTDDSFDDSPFECTDVVSYKDDIVPMINKSCANAPNCHQVGSEDGDFTNFSGTKETVSAILYRVYDLKDMPPSYTAGPKELTGLELNLLDCWIANGALDN